KSLSHRERDFEDLLSASSIHVEYLTAADDIETITTYLSVRNQGFDYHADEPPTKQEIAELSEQIQQGRMHCALARLDGIPAGIGVILPLFGIAELAGVATIPALRRRGVAATLCSVLVNDHFQSGGDLVWLSAGDEIAQATYERIGFRVVDTRLNYINATVKEYKHY
ncbi:MAG TPA: GNAT family N-acetyltransferase, partial [Coleofasciculaceae cyanobacterium]